MLLCPTLTRCQPSYPPSPSPPPPPALCPPPLQCNLVWRVARAGGEPLLSRELHARQEAREALLQKTLLELQAVVRDLGGTFIAGTGWT